MTAFESDLPEPIPGASDTTMRAIVATPPRDREAWKFPGEGDEVEEMLEPKGVSR